MPWGNTPEDRRRSNTTYGTDWRKARLACLKAARWKCQIRLQGCSGAASEVDHIDGAQNDPHHKHLRAACKPCHAQVTAEQGHTARWGNSGTPKDPAVQQRTDW
jgi:5-methylcytosine-specific restriction endonuclease McrA